jgi:alpha-galactosidase/6-phospho-beta-glucosidase family protein
MNFSKIKNLSNKEYKQETKKRQSLSAQRTLKIRDKDKNRQQLKIARKEYIDKKYKEYEIAIKKALEHFKQNNMKINVSQIAKFTDIDRRMVKKVLDVL